MRKHAINIFLILMFVRYCSYVNSFFKHEPFKFDLRWTLLASFVSEISISSHIIYGYKVPWFEIEVRNDVQITIMHCFEVAND